LEDAESGSTVARPVRRGLSAEMRSSMVVDTRALDGAIEGEATSESPSTWKHEPDGSAKSEEELARISAAVKANVLFEGLADEQRSAMAKAMVRRTVAAGERVIKAGSRGEWFYIVDTGEYTVLVGNPPTEMLTYKPSATPPCFGELALLYGKPRGASVVARTDGRLWALDRETFRSITVRASDKALHRTLRNVRLFASLSVDQLRELAKALKEVVYEPGERVVKAGRKADAFYIISEGRAIVTKEEAAPAAMGDNDDRRTVGVDGSMRTRAVVAELKVGEYFGERSLLFDEKFSTTVRAAKQKPGQPMQKLRCLVGSREAFEDVLGPMKEIVMGDLERTIGGPAHPPHGQPATSPSLTVGGLFLLTRPNPNPNPFTHLRWALLAYSPVVPGHAACAAAFLHQIRLKIAGLAGATISDFTLRACAHTNAPVDFVLARHKRKGEQCVTTRPPPRRTR
jgi:cAMP-dependent protein kinase regulator